MNEIGGHYGYLSDAEFIEQNKPKYCLVCHSLDVKWGAIFFPTNKSEYFGATRIAYSLCEEHSPEKLKDINLKAEKIILENLNEYYSHSDQ